MSEALPVTPNTIAEQTIAAAEAGATILHLYARNPENGARPVDPEHFELFLLRIKQATDAIVSISTSGNPVMTVAERIPAARRFSPEMCSLNMGLDLSRTPCRPVVWPSNRLLEDELALTERAVRYRLREMESRGLIAVIESPNGKCYGRRDKAGYIIEAFGFDLSPLACRLEEFMVAAEQARAERAERKELRRSITITRKQIIQIGTAGIEAGFSSVDWHKVIEQAGTKAAPAAHAELIKDLIDVLGELSELHEQAAEVYCTAFEAAEVPEEQSIDSVDNFCGKQKDIAPKGETDCPHKQLQLNQPSFKKDTRSSATPIWQRKNSGLGQPPSPIPNHPRCGTVDKEVEQYKLNPKTLADIFPELGLGLISDCPGWTDIHDAAGHLCLGPGISQDAWGEACQIMGRDGAAISVAIITAKAHEIRSPGDYLRKMTDRARTGELHLGPSVYGIRDRR